MHRKFDQLPAPGTVVVAGRQKNVLRLSQMPPREK